MLFSIQSNLWGHVGVDAHRMFINYEIEDEKFIAYFYYVNHFGKSTLINNDFSNSDLTLVDFSFSTEEGNNFDNAILGCFTYLEGHASEIKVCAN